MNHPFEDYEIGKVISKAKGIYFYRVDEDKLWEVQGYGSDDPLFETETYIEPNTFRRELTQTEQVSFINILVTFESHNVQQCNPKKNDEPTRDANEPNESFYQCDFDKSETVVVFQHEYAITNAFSLKPILGTFGAGTCIIMALYNASTRTALLAHIDHKTDFDHLASLIKEFIQRDTIAHLIGGNQSSALNFHKVKKIIQGTNTLIKNSIPNKSIFDEASLAIDARNGKLFSPVMAKMLDCVRRNIKGNLLADLLEHSTPLTNCFDESKLNPQQKAPKKRKITNYDAKNPFLTFCDTRIGSETGSDTTAHKNELKTVLSSSISSCIKKIA